MAENSVDDAAYDIRWQQRLSNYQRALARLLEAVTLRKTRPLSDLEQQGLVDGEVWMDMILGRNLSSHTYNLDIANALVEKIALVYAVRFQDFEVKMLGIKNRGGA